MAARGLARGCIAVALLLTGCSGDDTDADATTTAAPTTTAESTTTTVPERPASTTTTEFDPASVEGEVEAAYLRSWDVYAEAVYNLELDEEALAEVYAGPADWPLRAGDRVAESMRGVRRSSTVEHDYQVEITGPDTAAVIDTYQNHQVLIDPVTKEPVEADPDEQLVDAAFTLRRVNGTWVGFRSEAVVMKRMFLLSLLRCSPTSRRRIRLTRRDPVDEDVVTGEGAVQVTIVKAGGSYSVAGVSGGGSDEHVGCVWTVMFSPGLDDTPYGTSAGPMPTPDSKFALLLCNGSIVRAIWVQPDDIVDLDAVAEDEAQRYIEDVLVPSVRIGVNPEVQGLVGLRSWFWIEGFDGSITAPPITAFGMTIDVRMSSGTITWDFGDGSVEDGDLGRPYPAESSSSTPTRTTAPTPSPPRSISCPSTASTAAPGSPCRASKPSPPPSTTSRSVRRSSPAPDPGQGSWSASAIEGQGREDGGGVARDRRPVNRELGCEMIRCGLSHPGSTGVGTRVRNDSPLPPSAPGSQLGRTGYSKSMAA